MRVRIEIHLDSKEVKLLDRIAESKERSRKKLCEMEIRKMIASEQKKLTASQ